jgi:hypothetical protein
MTATNERTGTPLRSRPRMTRRHEDAVIAAEVRRLARALAPCRVLSRETPRRRAGADSRQEGGVERDAQRISPSARAQSTVLPIVSRGSV